MISKVLKTQLLTFMTLIAFGMSAFAAADDVVSLEDLYELDGVYYKKFTSEPFSGTLRYHFNKLHFDDGKERISSNEYYQNGKLIMKEEFCKNGRLKSKHKLNGNLSAYEDGKYVIYHCNGKIESQWSVLNGKTEGDFLKYYENGKMLRKTPYKKGKINGVVERYEEDGKLADTKTYVEDKLNGVSSKFYPNGNIAIKTEYLNDKKDGATLYYSADGDLLRKEQFKKGKRDGVSFVYHKKKSITEEWLFKNGVALKPLSPLVILEGFPICSVLSSKGQFCKSLDKKSRQSYNFNKLKKSRFKPKVDWPNRFELKSADWRYSFELVPLKGVKKKTFLNPNTKQTFEAIVGNTAKLQFTDEALTATYYTVVTYDLEFSEKEQNWFLMGSVVDDLRGNEEDRKVIGKYRKYDPPIPFLNALN